MKQWRTGSVVGLLIVMASWQMGSAIHLMTKAWLAQHLLQRAWSQTMQRQKPVRPWPWADTTTYGQLTVQRLNIEQIVLMGDSGRTLAFGPGLSEASSADLDSGITVISGHRDTHFAFLQHLQEQDVITLANVDTSKQFRVIDRMAVDARRSTLDLDQPGHYLVLVTCFPFDAIEPGGHQRYVVIAEPIPSHTNDPISPNSPS